MHRQNKISHATLMSVFFLNSPCFLVRVVQISLSRLLRCYKGFSLLSCFPYCDDQLDEYTLSTSGFRYPDKRRDQVYEPKLHRLQAPTDQSSSVAQGLSVIFLFLFSFESVSTILSTQLFEINFDQIFHKRMPPEAVDLVSRLLQYSPNLRCSAVSTKSFLTFHFKCSIHLLFTDK